MPENRSDGLAVNQNSFQHLKKRKFLPIVTIREPLTHLEGILSARLHQENVQVEHFTGFVSSCFAVIVIAVILFLFTHWDWRTDSYHHCVTVDKRQVFIDCNGNVLRFD